MEPPEGPLQGSKYGGDIPPSVTNLNNEAIPGKHSYATMVTAPPSSTLNPTRPDKENVIARQMTHNGMLAVIFKAKDYYGPRSHFEKDGGNGEWEQGTPRSNERTPENGR